MSYMFQPGTQGILWAIPQKPFPAICHLHGPVKERCHHITLGLGPLTERWRAALGTHFEALFLAEAWSHILGVQAYVARLPDVIHALSTLTPEQDRFRPHLTLFTAEGVSAFASNTMLAGPHNSMLPAVTSLPVRIEFCPEEDIPTAQQSYRLRG